MIARLVDWLKGRKWTPCEISPPPSIEEARRHIRWVGKSPK